MAIQSTINDSEEDDTESDPNRNPKVATYTTKVNSPQKLLINRLIPNIIPGAICPIAQKITEDMELIRETLDTQHTVLSKEVVADAARSGARFFRNPREVSRTSRDGTTPQDVNTAVAAVRLNPPIQTFHNTYDSPTRTGTQDIFNPIGPVGPQWISNADKTKNFH